MHNATAAPQNNCNQPCAGNPAEACGQSNRIQIYEDSLNPTSSPILTISTTTSTLTLKPTSSPLPTILTTMSTSTSKPISSPPPTASTTTLNPTSSHTSSPPPTTLTTTSNPTSSHTPTASTSSSSTSSTLIPTLVPFVGTFSNIGCFFDTTVARVLVANSSINLTPGTGMTVEECIGFAQQGGFQFGGVEFGGYVTCYGPLRHTI
jgi:hypothetical protein